MNAQFTFKTTKQKLQDQETKTTVSPSWNVCMVMIRKDVHSLPGPHLSRFCKSEWELGSTQNLTHALSLESLHDMWHTAALTSASPQLSEVSVSPRQHTAVVSECESLGITTAAGNVYRMMTWQSSNLFRFKLCLVVAMPQPAVFAKAPGEELASGQDGCTVGTTAGDFLYRLTFQGFNKLWAIVVPTLKQT